MASPPWGGLLEGEGGGYGPDGFCQHESISTGLCARVCVRWTCVQSHTRVCVLGTVTHMVHEPEATPTAAQHGGQGGVGESLLRPHQSHLRSGGLLGPGFPLLTRYQVYFYRGSHSPQGQGCRRERSLGEGACLAPLPLLLPGSPTDLLLHSTHQRRGTLPPCHACPHPVLRRTVVPSPLSSRHQEAC